MRDSSSNTGCTGCRLCVQTSVHYPQFNMLQHYGLKELGVGLLMSYMSPQCLDVLMFKGRNYYDQVRHSNTGYDNQTRFESSGCQLTLASLLSHKS